MQLSSVQRLDRVIEGLRFVKSQIQDNGLFDLSKEIDDNIHEIGSIIEED